METAKRFLGAIVFAIARLFCWQRRNARFVVLIGGPGAGKGTLAAKLAPVFGLPHLSMGEIIRKEIASGSQLGRTIEPVVSSGKLLDDRTTTRLLKRELSNPEYFNGAVLDGIPRTFLQARLLDRMLFWWGNQIEKVFLLEVPEEDLIERLAHRRTCRNCGKVYHLEFSPPEADGICDDCGGELYQRKDDNPESIRQRLAVYRKESAPLLDYYRNRQACGRDGLFVVVESTNAKGPEAVLAEVTTALRG